MLMQFDKNTILKEIQKTPEIFGVLCNIRKVADTLQYYKLHKDISLSCNWNRRSSGQYKIRKCK